MKRREVGASQWCLKMHAAFLSERSMSVKLGTVLSEPRPVTGGAVQGSVLGVLDHNIVLNNLDDDLLSIYVAKYIDDMTLIDTVDNSVPTVIDNSPSRPLHTINPEETQNAFNSICRRAAVKGLKINDQKTQLLSVSSGYYTTKAVIKDASLNEIYSSPTLKMLGYTFSETPTVQAQLDYLMRKANKRLFLLLNFKRSGVPKDKLKDLYGTMNRYILEYTSNVYHPQLNKGQSNQLEKIQKRCLRIIYGYEHDYATLLNMSGLQTLEERRVNSFDKFTKNTAKNPKYNHWFPINPAERTGRNTNKYLEETATGTRLYNSPIFSMRRHLNRTSTLEQIDLTGFFNLP